LQEILRHRGRQRHDGTVKTPNVRMGLRTSSRELRACLGKEIVDQNTNQAVNNLSDKTAEFERTKLVCHPLRHRTSERCRNEIVHRKKSGAQSVVDVVIHISYVVGNGGDLRLDPRPARQIQRPLSVEIRNRPRKRCSSARQRTVMLHQSFKRFPGEIETVERGVAMLERRQEPERVGVVIEAADRGGRGVERILPGMAERRVAEIVGEAQCLGEILIDGEHPRHRARNLGDFERMGKAGAVVIAFVLHEDLRLVLQAAKRGGMDNAVAIALVARSGRAFRLGMKPSAAPFGPRCIRCHLQGRHEERRQEAARRGVHGLCSGDSKSYTKPTATDRYATMDVQQASAFTITSRAARRVAEIVSAEGGEAMLRVAVTGGGCSGFQYSFALDDARADDDLVIERDGATVLVDPMSLDFLKGAELDFVDDLIGAAFKINNPNATSSCGCGTSFSV